MSHVIAIVGRPNVGKSRLFNRLVDRGDEAIVHGEPGVTRDRQYGYGRDADGESFTVVDTGGLVRDADDGLMERMRDQAEIAIEEADAIVFVMDARAGLRPGDREIAEKLRHSETPVVFAVNKVDPGTDEHELLAEFYQLGVDLQPISAEHDRGIRPLRDALMAHRTEQPPVDEDDESIRCAIVGRPNVGKSTFLNALLGEERVITSQTPGTTRDSIDTRLTRDGREYLLIDTAGMRRKSNVAEGLEELAVIQSIRSIDRAEVAVILIDGPEGVTNQDQKIASVVERRGCACLLVVNKWDLVERRPETGDLYRDYVRHELEFLDWAPLFFASAKTGRRVGDVLGAVDRIHEHHGFRIETSTLNDFLEEATERHNPPMQGGRRVKFYYGTQVSTGPPTFVFFVNRPEDVADSYKRYLANRLREAFDFEGTPLRLHVKSRD